MSINFFKPQPKVLAHRGDSLNFPENTEPAFKSAINMGVDVIESDLHLLKDGNILLFHDPTLQRTCNDPRMIANLTKEDLKYIDAGATFQREGSDEYPFKGMGIHPLTLKEVLNLFPEAKFNFDLKTKNKIIAQNAASILKEARAEERVCIASFHDEILKAFREYAPHVKTSLSQKEIIQSLALHRFNWTPKGVKTGQVKAIQVPEGAGPIKVVTPSLIKWCKQHNLALQVWTINSPEKMTELLKKGVDGLFTDDPALLIKQLATQF